MEKITQTYNDGGNKQYLDPKIENDKRSKKMNHNSHKSKKHLQPWQKR